LEEKGDLRARLEVQGRVFETSHGISELLSFSTFIHLYVVKKNRGGREGKALVRG